MRRDEFPVVESYCNDKVKDELKGLIKEVEHHIGCVTFDNPDLQRVYELGERHILDLIELRLKEKEGSK